MIECTVENKERRMEVRIWRIYRPSSDKEIHRNREINIDFNSDACRSLELVFCGWVNQDFYRSCQLKSM